VQQQTSGATCMPRAACLYPTLPASRRRAEDHPVARSISQHSKGAHAENEYRKRRFTLCHRQPRRAAIPFAAMAASSSTAAAWPAIPRHHARAIRPGCCSPRSRCRPRSQMKTFSGGRFPSWAPLRAAESRRGVANTAGAPGAAGARPRGVGREVDRANTVRPRAATAASSRAHAAATDPWREAGPSCGKGAVVALSAV